MELTADNLFCGIYYQAYGFGNQGKTLPLDADEIVDRVVRHPTPTPSLPPPVTWKMNERALLSVLNSHHLWQPITGSPRIALV